MPTQLRFSTVWPILLVFSTFLVSSSLAQAPATTPQPAPPKAAAATPDEIKEALIFESSHTKLTYQEDGSDVREVQAVIKVLSPAGVQGMAVLPFSYTSSNETVEFDYVRVRKPDGTVVVTPDYNIQDMPADVSRSAPMYSDVHEKHVTVKALGVGDTLEYLVRYRTTKPQVPGQFWYAYNFRKDVISKDEQLVIDVPKDKFVKVSSPDVKPEIKEQGERRTYTWKTANLERKDESKSRSVQPQRNTPPPSVQITTFHNWEEVGRWYGELARAQVTVTPQIKAKAAELTKGLTSDEDKMRALYDFVSTHYHYVSLSFGIGRYQPHPAEDVFENEYGDCKDKHTLLAALLKAAGYDAWPALMNATLTKIDADLPSPGQFDHVITVVPRPGKDVLWLDTTPGVAPFGMLLANLRDRQALVIPTDKPALLMTTPVNPPFASEQTFSVKGKLTAEGAFTGHIEVSANGDTGVVDRYLFQQYPASQWKDLVQQISYRLGFSGDVSAVTASDPADIEKPFTFSYEYKREKVGDWDNHQFVAPFPPIGLEAFASEQAKPDQPVFLGAPGTITYKGEIELPAGFMVVTPKDLELTEPFADFESKYEMKPAGLTVSRRLLIKMPYVSIAAWDSYQKMAKAIDVDWRSYITLSEKGNPSVIPTNPEAEKLFQEGYQALQNHDNTRAEESFRRVIQMDPKYPYAHANLGTTYLNEGDLQRGIEELRKEEELFPDEAYTHRMLARALAYKHQNAESMDEFRKLLALDPKDQDAALNLAQLLTQEKKYPETVTVLEKAMEQAPDSAPLQFQLGFAYVRNGQNDKGLALLQKALTAETDETRSSGELNDVAYTLVELNVGMDVAQQYAEKSIKLLDAQSLTAGGSQAFRNTSSLAATWDTVGWVYFKQGQYEKALPYIRSSWLLSQHAEVGDHLGQIYAKLGKKQEAARTYQLAYFALDKKSSFAAGKELLDKVEHHYQELMGSNANIGASTAHRSTDGKWSPDPVEELSRMREVKITSTSHPSASGTFDISFSPGKVDSVTQVDGDKSLAPMIEKIQTAKFNMEFPDSTPVKIVRRGIMSCGAMGCDMTLLPTDDRGLLALQ
jgi:tetratricopeptide (TPR) repeat protein/transglutaminase-like putative cysteine protease